MGIDAFGYILGGMTVFLTYLSFKTRSLPLSIIVAGLWIAFWRYINDNAVVDASILEIVTIISWAMAVLSVFMGFFSKGIDGGNGETKYDKWGRFLNPNKKEYDETRQYTRSSVDDYKSMVHDKLWGRRERRKP